MTMQAPVTYIVKMKTLTVAFSLNSNKFNFVNKSLSSVKKYAVVLFVLFMSCQDIFHEVDNPYLNIDNDQEKIDMVNGIYSRLVEVHNENYFALLSRSDDVNNFRNYNITEYYGECSSNSGPIDYSEIKGNIFLNLYTAIININRLLSVVSSSDEKALAGELYFLRSYSYFKLARLFGTPPIILDTEVSYTVEKPDYAEVYNQIEEDMLNALDLLPDTYSEARIPGETPHKGTAKAMLAEIYLNMGGFPLYNESKYAQAAQLAKEVIDDRNNYNFQLLDDFADLWREDNTHNAEYIFGLFFNDETGNNQNSLIKVTGGSSRNNSNWITSSWYHPEYKFYEDYPYNYRKYKTFLTGYYQDLPFESIDTLVNSLYFKFFDPINEPCDYVRGAGCLKWIYGTYDFNNEGFKEEKTSSTIYLLRYAQLLLTYAEAKARSGAIDETAFDVVNQIRRRSNHVDLYSPSAFDLSPNLTTEQFIDSVVWERAWELAMEPDTRWFDVIRLDLKDELAGNRYNRDQHTVVPIEFLTDEWYFYKIPQEDRWNNPNLE
jgi:hypothetical protein